MSRVALRHKKLTEISGNRWCFQALHQQKLVVPFFSAPSEFECFFLCQQIADQLFVLAILAILEWPVSPGQQRAKRSFNMFDRAGEGGQKFHPIVCPEDWF